MSELDLSDAEPALERRTDQLLGDDRIGLDDASARLVERHLVLIDLLLRAVLPVAQRLRALHLDRGHSRLRLEIGEVAALRLVIDLHQRVAFLDPPPG